MSPSRFAAVLIALPLIAQPPLPTLRTEPTTGGSIFFVKNTAAQPVTAYPRGTPKTGHTWTPEKRPTG